MEYIGEGGLNDIRQRIFKRRGQVKLGSGGLATIEFEPPIQLPREPYLQLTPRTQANQDIAVVNLVPGSFQTSPVGYTSAQIRGARIVGQLPTLNVVGGLLASVITGVNAIVSALSGFRLVRTENAVGVDVDWLAF